MKINIDIPKELESDLMTMANYHKVSIDDVIKHAIAEDIERDKNNKIGPWGSSKTNRRIYEKSS